MPTLSRRLASLLIGLLMLACASPVPGESLEEVKEKTLLSTYADCLSQGNDERFCRCALGQNRENIPVSWFDGKDEYNEEWTALAFAACQQHFTPTPTPAPFSVEDWDPYTPIPEGISSEDWAAAYEKWSVEYETLTLPWRRASELVETAWHNADQSALLSTCRYWNDLQGRIWTPQLVQLAKVIGVPSHPRRMDCREMVLNIYVPGADWLDFISEAP